MARKSGTRIKTIEKLCLLWVTLFTFCVGLAVVLPTYPSGINQNLILLFYIFLEFLPLLLFSYTVSQPSLRNVVLCLGLSILVIFPILTLLTMSLPALVFIRRRVPHYRRKIRNSQLYRIIFRKKTAAQIEEEILARRREQIKNTIITDKSYEQFIYVNRAANKWKRKVEMKRNQEKDILAEGNVTVNVGYGLDTVHEERSLTRNGTDWNSVDGKTQSNGNRIENGKMVTDV